jgi:alkylation response protein AidB-like acyl-CoA dehydrogenase
MFPRTLFQSEHEQFRDAVRKFIDREIRPFHHLWEKDGLVPRDLWLKAGEAGMLCCTIPTQYGGLGLDYLFDVVVFEEMGRSGFSGPGFMIHCDLVASYINSFGTEAQKCQWLPKMVSGEAIGSLGMTEPHAGSDLRNIRTRAVADGEDFLIDGQKVFISNGQLCDVIVLATRAQSGAAQGSGITLFLVDTKLPGFKRGRNLEKLGMKAQDTSELFFENLRVPGSAMLGALGGGFDLMKQKLVQERLAQSIRSAAVAEAALQWTVDYVAERKAFGKTIADFQNTQFKLAELHTEATLGRVFVDQCIAQFMSGNLDEIDAAMAKMWVTNLHCKLVDECLQLFGGWGYMWDYPIARAYADARVVKIAGGSIEIMKHIIGRSLFKRFRSQA